MTLKRRAAITGIGLITPLGNSRSATWEALLEGRGGVAPIASFDASSFPVRIAAEVKGFDQARATEERRLLKYAGRAHSFALAAAEEAIADSGTAPTESDSDRWGCVAGSGMMALEFREVADYQQRFAPNGELEVRKLLALDSGGLDPLQMCRAQVNAGVSLLLRRFGIRGYASSVHTACASGGQAVGTGLRVIRRGAADVVLAGGFDSMINPFGLAGFCPLGALSPDNNQPAKASRPFDRTRNGFVLGEGAGFLVLEEFERARRRGARIYAELAGDGNALSSYRITDSHPGGDGAIQAMKWALRDAAVDPCEVDYVNAHGTSTPMNDRSESAAIRAVFGAGVSGIGVSSTKSLMGHLISAAGAVEAAVCALTIHHGVMPFNANLEVPDPECDLEFIRDRPRGRKVRVALSNSFGFGGSNNCLVLRHPAFLQ